MICLVCELLPNEYLKHLFLPLFLVAVFSVMSHSVQIGTDRSQVVETSSGATYIYIVTYKILLIVSPLLLLTT